MNNYSKMTLFVVSALFLVAFAGFASAAHPYNTYTYSDRNTFSYNENDHGFRISSSERDHSHYSYGNRGYSHCGDTYSWRSYGCGSRYSNRPYYPDHAWYQNDYDEDAAIKMAFDSYNKGRQYDYQIEKLRIQEEAKKNRYRYGGYGSGYSGRIYQY